MRAKKFLALIGLLLITSATSAQDLLPRKAPHDDKTKDTADVYDNVGPIFVPEIGEQISSAFFWQDFEDALKGVSYKKTRKTYHHGTKNIQRTKSVQRRSKSRRTRQGRRK